MSSAKAALKIAKVWLEVNEDMSGKQLAGLSSLVVNNLRAFLNGLLLVGITTLGAHYLEVFILGVPEMSLEKVRVCSERKGNNFFHD
jgi:hypothetical protein